MTELVRYIQRLNAWRNLSVAEREEYPLYPLPWQEVSLTDLRQSPDTGALVDSPRTPRRQPPH